MAMRPGLSLFLLLGSHPPILATTHAAHAIVPSLKGQFPPAALGDHECTIPAKAWSRPVSAGVKSRSASVSSSRLS